jgi:hypothetical protein
MKLLLKGHKYKNILCTIDDEFYIFALDIHKYR